MAKLFSGEITTSEYSKSFKAIFGKDVKINVYNKDESSPIESAQSSEAFIQQQMNALLGMTVNEISTVGAVSTKNLHSSYISKMRRDPDRKELVQDIKTYGDTSIAHEILRLTSHTFLKTEEVKSEQSHGANGVQEYYEFSKETIKGTIRQKENLLGGIRKNLEIHEQYVDGTYFTLVMEETGNSTVNPTKGIEYSKGTFDIGQVRENAIHSQIRSIQHLRTIKDIAWVDELIEDGSFRIVEEEQHLREVIKEIQADMKQAKESKGITPIIYYDTESTGLNLFNLPPDHPDKDMMAAHVISWVCDRDMEIGGYPTKIKTIVVPVGMKYTKNVDEVKAAQMLRPLLTNTEIEVCAHNADFEMQIALRYSEIEGELSYNKYHNWITELREQSKSVSKGQIEMSLENIDKEIEKLSEDYQGMALMMQTRELNANKKELEALLNIESEIERVRELPKGEKPYISDQKGEDIYRLNVTRDTLVLSRMVNNGANNREGNPFMRHRLEDLTWNYLEKEQLSLDDVYGNAQSSEYKIYDFSLLPREYMFYYACVDTHVLPFIEWHLERQPYLNMKSLGINEREAQIANMEMLNIYYETDVPFAIHMAEFANYKGIGIDKDRLDDDKAEQEEGRDLILQFMEEITGEDIKWTSTKQVGPLLFGRYRYPILYRTQTNLPSYNRATRQHHMRQTKAEHEFRYKEVVPLPKVVNDVVDSRGNVILNSAKINELQAPLSYIYQEFADRHKDLTSFTSMIYERTYNINGEWIYFPNYIATSTDTGRASGGIMIMKREKKETFRARRGHVLHGGDLDQAELRLIATMCRDEEEIEHFKDPRYDPHRRTGALVNNVDESEVTGEMRDAAKVFNFGDAYGIGAEAASKNIYPDLVPVPKALVLKTAILQNKFKKAYPVKTAWLNNLRAKTVEYGYSKTPNGRYKWFPETKDEDSEQWELARAGRQGGNVPIQGFCADFIKDRIVQVFRVLKECGITRFFTQPIFVHDEYFAEVNKEAFIHAPNKKYTKEMVKEEQQFNILWLYDLVYSQFTERPLGIDPVYEAPMTMGIGMAETWLRGQSDLYGLPGELQEIIIGKYREDNISEELYNSLTTEPINAVLDEIRIWWATQAKKALEKVGVKPNKIPKRVDGIVEDLFIKGNLKDIFSISPKQLVEMGLEKDDYFTGQCILAMKFLNGEDVEIIDKLENSDEVILEAESDLDMFFNEEVIDLKVYREIRKDQERLSKQVRYSDYADYDKVFKESKLLQFGLLMLNDNTSTLEINIRGLNRRTLENLKTYFDRKTKNGTQEEGYQVLLLEQDKLSSRPSSVLKTDYRVQPSENNLMEIRSILDQDKEYKKDDTNRMLKAMAGKLN